MRALGLKLAHEDLERGTVFLSFGKQHHDLALFEPVTGPRARLGPSPACTTPRGSSGASRSSRPPIASCKAMGFAVESTVEHNVTRSVYFPDPDGNRVELYCDMVEHGFDAMRTLGPKRDTLDMETGEVQHR